MAINSDADSLTKLLGEHKSDLEKIKGVDRVSHYEKMVKKLKEKEV